MKMLYSKLTNGFYCKSVHSPEQIPNDALEITDRLYNTLMSEQSAGAVIVPDKNGMPVTIIQSETPLEVARRAYGIRDALATAQIDILRPAVDGGYAKLEHSLLLADWQRYRYELTLVQEQTGWPELPQWPEQPEVVV